MSTGTPSGNRAPMADEMLTPEQRADYLAGLADHNVPKNEAAHAIGFTGTKIRHLRTRDRVFDDECARAEAERALGYAEALADTAKARAEISDRILEVELASKGGPEYTHLRRDRVKVDAQVTGVVIQIDPGTLDEMSLEAKRELRDTLARLGGRLIEQGQNGPIHDDIEQEAR